MKRQLRIIALSVFALGCVTEFAHGQEPDSAHSIRLSTILVGPVINNRIVANMAAQNIAVTYESAHVVEGSPLDAPEIQIRINIAEAESGSLIVLSAVGTTPGGGGSYRGTGSITGASVFAVDRGTHRGKEWERLEALAAALRRELVAR